MQVTNPAATNPLRGQVNNKNDYMRLQRIIFVGMHNKPGMRPLDDKTKSGKLVERIAKQVRNKGNEVVKTNLFNVDHYPKAHDISTLAFDWIERVELHQHDIVVLLGACVHKHFPKIPVKKIEIAHPSSQWSHENMDNYVKRTVALIKNAEQAIQDKLLTP